MDRLDQLKSILQTLKRTVKAGQVKASEEKIEARLALCLPCENFKVSERKGNPICSLCGCQLKRKVLVEGAECPLNKW